MNVGETTAAAPVQLHVVHGLGGGIERWCRDYCEADRERTNLILRPFADEGKLGAGLMLYASIHSAEPEHLWLFDQPFGVVTESHPEYRRVVEGIIRDHGVGGLVVSSLIGHSLDVLDLGLPTQVVTHDYFPVCPAIYAYFDAPCTACDDARCRECQQDNPPAFNPFSNFPADDRLRVRQRYLELLARPDTQVISPTRSAQTTWRNVAASTDGIRFEVIAHGEGRSFAPIKRSRHEPSSRLQVVLLGDLSEHKGLRLLLEAMPSITEFADLHLVGAGVAGRFFERQSGVSVIESYRLEELQALLERIDPDVGLLLSVCPETFGYALSELSAMAVPVVATRVGSFPERIVDGETGYLIEPSVDQLAEKLRHLANSPESLVGVRERLQRMTPRTASAMVADYHRAMPIVSPAEGVRSVVEAQTPVERWVGKLAARTSALVRDAERLWRRTEIDAWQLDDKKAQIDWLRQQLHLREQRLREGYEAQQECKQLKAERDMYLNSIERIDTLSAQVANLEGDLAETRRQLGAVLESTSWTITRPLRFVVRLLKGDRRAVLEGVRHHVLKLGKQAYWHVPVRWRAPLLDLVYRFGGPIFKGRPDYERWRMQGRLGVAGSAAGRNDMVDLDEIAPLPGDHPGRIAIHAHLFYAELAAEFAEQFARMPFAFDLYVSVRDEAGKAMCERAFGGLDRLGTLVVAVVPNRGRDIAPMFCTFGEQLVGYDFIAHLHSKKSLYNQGRTTGWREYLVQGLFGSAERIRRIFSLLAGGDRVGMVYPQTYSDAPYFAHTWLANRNEGLTWCHRLGLRAPQGYFDFPVGSMFWARGDVLRPLFDAGLKLEDFPPEQGQTDGTLAHVVERLLGLLPSRQGFSLGILRDEETPSWSKWRMDRPLSRSAEAIAGQVSDPEYRVVVCDIFDTLLLRPLIDAEDVKRVVARRIGGEAGERYLAERHRVESEARRKAGRDVGLDAIYAEWATWGSLPETALAQLRTLEEAAELASVAARPEAAWLLERARSAGRRVLLASDMYLPRSVVESMLTVNAVTGWQKLYLSNETGVRKDSGELYRRLLSDEGIPPSAAIMVGDNERADFQIPNNLGMAFCHLPRPVEIARSLPRWHVLIERQETTGDLDASLTLGMVVRHCLGSLDTARIHPDAFVPDARRIGYAVVGPVVLAFSAWLGRQARTDGAERLYFLSREGAILKRVYDRWLASTGEGPPSEYLVLSRRSVTVPMIESIDDVVRLAEARFFPNELDMFLRERYGLVLDDAQWQEIERRGLWKRGKPLEVRGKNVDHLRPLLDHLLPAILSQAASEKPALMAYLHKMNLAGGRHAVVDVGYSGTIQARLIRLLGHPVDGYYMITTTTARAMAEEHGVLARGCFGDGLVPDSQELGLYRQSFELEKLLSSDESQIVRYRLHEGDMNEAAVEPVYRQNCDVLQATQAVRAEIQAGLMDYVDEALSLRKDLLPDFVVPLELAIQLFDALVTDASPLEQEILKAIVLDDYYCGRGLVA